MQVKYKINKNESFEDLHKNMKLSPQITLETIEKIFKGNLKTKNKGSKKLKKAPKFIKDIIINWKKMDIKIHNFIRGFIFQRQEQL